MALTPPYGNFTKELIQILVVVPDADSEERIHPIPIYRFKIKAQGVLIREASRGRYSTAKQPARWEQVKEPSERGGNMI
jgi:hypothetical protein